MKTRRMFVQTVALTGAGLWLSRGKAAAPMCGGGMGGGCGGGGGGTTVIDPPPGAPSVVGLPTATI